MKAIVLALSLLLSISAVHAGGADMQPPFMAIFGAQGCTLKFGAIMLDGDVDGEISTMLLRELPRLGVVFDPKEGVAIMGTVTPFWGYHTLTLNIQKANDACWQNFGNLVEDAIFAKLD